MPKRIPISAAKKIASEHDCRQVILLAWDGDLTHVVTYGKSVEDCDQAAQGGDKLKSALGWPAAANALPSRVKAANARAEAAEAEASHLRERVATLEGALRKRIEWHKCSCPEPCDDYWIFPGGCSSRYAEDYRNLLAALATQEQARVAGEPTRVDDGFITWGGGECPVPAGTRVLLRFCDGEECETNMPGHWDWTHHGGPRAIIAYRILPKETKYSPTPAAEADPSGEFERAYAEAAGVVPPDSPWQPEDRNASPGAEPPVTYYLRERRHTSSIIIAAIGDEAERISFADTVIGPFPSLDDVQGYLRTNGSLHRSYEIERHVNAQQIRSIT